MYDWTAWDAGRAARRGRVLAQEDHRSATPALHWSTRCISPLTCRGANINHEHKHDFNKFKSTQIECPSSHCWHRKNRAIESCGRDDQGTCRGSLGPDMIAWMLRDPFLLTPLYYPQLQL
ncbi:hypothetical protein J6590_003447 [Homalodisca vitripennis]|nr:hypothetical protein J6590_003447 [Homalodisca vitripennis]